jgi:hypothetical protein
MLGLANCAMYPLTLEQFLAWLRNLLDRQDDSGSQVAGVAGWVG